MIKNPPSWPDQARCAVAFSFDMDADSVVHAAHRAGALDMPHALAHMRYDPFVATPRLVDLFAEHDVPLTCFVPGWVIEAYPSAIETILKHDNEIGHHGYFHEWPNQQTVEEERWTLRHGLDTIERFSGRRPRGYRAPYYGISRVTFDLLIEAGLTYDSSLFADDVPILLDNGRGRLFELSVPASVDDYNQYVSSRAFDYVMKISSPQQALDVYQAEFDALWEFGGLWISAWHPAVSGRPQQALAIRNLIRHMQAKGGVWFATLSEIADHVGGLVEAGEWQPRIEHVPFYSAPVLSARP